MIAEKNILLVRTNSDNEDFKQLVTMLDKDLAIRDGAEHAFYAQFNKTTNLSTVIVAYIGKRAIGCGAFKEYNHATVEIKRMFVHPDVRGRGIAVEILKALEGWAEESGYESCVLETGRKQPEAISLYKKCGYEITPNYGQYKNVANSICMKKDLMNEDL